MTTSHHTPISTGAAANAATVNAPLAELDTYINDRVVVPAPAFSIVNGSPGVGELGYTSGVLEFGTWRLDDSVTEAVGTGIPVPSLKSGSTIYLDIYWAMESATSGNIRLSVGLDAFASGEDVSVLGSGASDSTITVPSTAKELKLTTLTLSVSYVAGDILRLRVARSGASDTATGDMHFIAALVRFA